MKAQPPSRPRGPRPTAPPDRRASRGRTITLLALLASVVAHLALVLWGPAMPRAPGRRRARKSVEVDFAPWVPPHAAPKANPAPPPTAVPSAPPPRVARSRRRTAAPAPAPAPAEVAIAALPAPAPTAELPPTTPRESSTCTMTEPSGAVVRIPGCLAPDAGAPRAPAGWANIAPGAAARSVVPPEGSGPSSPDAQASAALTRDLRTQANARPWISHRAPPHLTHTPDGGYAWVSPGLSAEIAPDGTVRFHNRHVSFSQAGAGAQMGFDLTDELMRANGQDPYSYERNWFLDQTQSLRDRLADQAALRARTEALARLPGRLAAIWRNTSKSPHARRVAIFELWDDCADDEAGTRARRIVEHFIRDRLPAGGPDAYTAEELRTLNARRESPVPFAPYA